MHALGPEEGGQLHIFIIFLSYIPKLNVEINGYK